MPVLAYVSLWSADLLALGEAVDRVAEVADAFHIDVFDGHNAPELLFGPDVVAALRARTGTLLDVHLNVTDPDYWLERFVDAGADMVTVQSGASPDIRATLGAGPLPAGACPSLGLEVHEPLSPGRSAVRRRRPGAGDGHGHRHQGRRPGPGHPATRFRPGRRPGRRFGAGLGPTIVVDGGIRPHTVGALAEAGADGVVPGSLVFASADPVARICELHALAPAVAAP